MVARSRFRIESGELFCWLLSFSWIVGITPPTRWLSEDASPWWIAELAAAAVGACALVLGVLVLRASRPGSRRLPLIAVILGGSVAVLSILEMARPAQE